MAQMTRLLVTPVLDPGFFTGEGVNITVYQVPKVN